MSNNQFEKEINHIVINGGRISEGGLGTILPTARQLASADRFADQQARKFDESARRRPELSKCARRIVGGEIRYYSNADKFAIITRSNLVKWFEVRANGYTYAVK